MKQKLHEQLSALVDDELPQAEQALLKARQGEPDKCKDIEVWVRTALRHLR